MLLTREQGKALSAARGEVDGCVLLFDKAIELELPVDVSVLAGRLSRMPCAPGVTATLVVIAHPRPPRLVLRCAGTAMMASDA